MGSGACGKEERDGIHGAGEKKEEERKEKKILPMAFLDFLMIAGEEEKVGEAPEKKEAAGFD
jgi:hypothetical protein